MIGEPFQIHDDKINTLENTLENTYESKNSKQTFLLMHLEAEFSPTFLSSPPVQRFPRKSISPAERRRDCVTY